MSNNINKQVSISLAEAEIATGQDLHGTITINYSARWDSIVINSQIENSNDIFSYMTINGKNIRYPYARLSIFKTELGYKTNAIKFTAVTKHIPAAEYSNAKFRVSIIQEHKEVTSDTARLKIIKRD